MSTEPKRIDVQTIGAWIGIGATFVALIAFYNQLKGRVDALTPDLVKAEYDLGIKKLHAAVDGVPVIPVGGVVMWWGDVNRIPPGFELCDGNKPQLPDAEFTGKKPNLVDCFPKGAPPDRKIMEDLTTGGSNNLHAHFHGPGNLAVAGGGHNHSGGDHSHEVPLSDDDHGDDRRAGNAEHEDPRDSIILDRGGHTHGGGEHVHSFTGTVGGVGTVNGDGSDLTGANQPSYCELFFIIRVK